MIQVQIRKTWEPRAGRPGFSLVLDVTADEGITAVFGPAGAGKTSLLEAVAGLLKPDAGRIMVGGEILFDAAAGVDLPVRARPCSLVAAGSAPMPHMTLRENLLFAAACRRLPRLEGHRRANELLERFGLAERSRCYPGNLSAADRQRAILARAMMSQPRLLLVDDPARGLEEQSRPQSHALLHWVRSTFGVSVLVATRALEDCYELGGQVLVICGGRLAQSGPPMQVASQPASLEVARALGGYNLLPAQITALDPGRNTSRLRLAGGELAGPYLPGRLRGDNVTLCARPADLSASPASGKPGLNQVPGRLLRITQLPRGVLLRFEGGITVEMPAAEYEACKHCRDWVIEFPPRSLRVL